MPRRSSPLAELWAWLFGFVAPVGGMAVALLLALGHALAGGAPPVAAPDASAVAGARVAGAATDTAVTTAASPTATPRESLSGPLVAVPAAPSSPAALAPAPLGDVGAASAPSVAGVQLQTPAQNGLAPAPFIGRVGGRPLPVVPAAAGVVLGLAGLALRGHTRRSKTAWTSSSSPSPCVMSTRKPSRSPSSSFRPG